jgi:hypothetical protein
MKPHVAADRLRNAIAECLHQVSANELAEICNNLGLESGETGEAFKSKRVYVRRRLGRFGIDELIAFGRKVLTEYECRALEDLIAEATLPPGTGLSEITRRDVLKVLNSLPTLFGDTDLYSGLSTITPESIRYDELARLSEMLPSLASDIDRHYVCNADYSIEELLIKCGALTCAQSRFFALVEKLLDPVVRRGPEQSTLAESIGSMLAADGFAVEAVASRSRHPIYAVRGMASGASGRPKNIIFASINTKPDLYFIDAINNDIAIGNASDALVYDLPLTEGGLSWNNLVEWWRRKEAIADGSEAQRSLYRRLQQAVKCASSPGELVLFDTYYREVGPALDDSLPALVPQVYLHYDPQTIKRRGASPNLVRQRMDFLILLDRNVRVVIEVDGKRHYSSGEIASPERYAEMVREDRRLRLAGYELYRFGAGEFGDTHISAGRTVIGNLSRKLAAEFFAHLFERHHVKSTK